MQFFQVIVVKVEYHICWGKTKMDASRKLLEIAMVRST